MFAPVNFKINLLEHGHYSWQGRLLKFLFKPLRTRQKNISTLPGEVISFDWRKPDTHESLNVIFELLEQ